MSSQLKEENWNQTMRPKGKNAEHKKLELNCYGHF